MSCEDHGYKHFGFFKVVGTAILGAFAAVVLALVFGYFIQQLWNWLMPKLFHLSVITYWEAFGLALLARLLFGGMGQHHGEHHRRFHEHFAQHHKRHPYWQGHGDGSGEWELKGGWHDWRYYDRWWRAEGKQSFERFIDRLKETKEGDHDQS